MEIVSFVINFALKVCPNDFLSTNQVCESYVQIVPNFQNLNTIIYFNPISKENEIFSIDHAYDQYSVSSTPYNKGWEIVFSNNSDAPFAFYLDVNTKSIDLSKPCRIKTEYSNEFYDQVIAQNDPNVFKKMHAWNSTAYSNVIQFDTLSPRKIFEDSSAAMYLWNPRDANFSTEWFKQSIVVKIDPGNNAFMKIDFFDLEDLNFDRRVNSEDLTIALNAWGGSGGDVDGDGITNAIDTGMILSKWRESSSN